jgi:hypothetical protein
MEKNNLFLQRSSADLRNQIGNKSAERWALENIKKILNKYNDKKQGKTNQKPYRRAAIKK